MREGGKVFSIPTNRHDTRETQSVHDRRLMATEPRIPIMPGRSTSGFHQPGRHRLHQARSAVRCSASRMKGELHASKNHTTRVRKKDFGILRLISCLWMTAPMGFFVFWCGHSRDSERERGGGGKRTHLLLALAI